MTIRKRKWFTGWGGQELTNSVAGALSVGGNFAVATTKFTVAAASGNTAVAGTLGVASDFAVATSKFTVAAASGNTAVAGTLSVAGDVAINTNKLTVTASSGNTAIAGTLTVAGLVTASVGIAIPATKGLLLTPGAAAGTSEGMVYYDSTAHKLKVYTGSAWETVTSA